VPYENLSQLLNNSFEIYSKAILIDTHKEFFGERLYFNEDMWEYLQSLNYFQFLEANVLDVETSFIHTVYAKKENLEFYSHSKNS